MGTTRRRFLERSALSAAVLGLGGVGALRAPSAAGAATSPYGPLGTADADGVRLPAGFSARLVAATGAPVTGTSYVWHAAPDGAQTAATPDGGWLLVQNGEENGKSGGASVIRFDPGGAPVDAYRILTGTKWNCAGGLTPWGTWLSCEEFRNGQVWECDPSQAGQGVVRPLLGSFIHEAAPVDPATGYVYLTEDAFDARLYRFRPESPGNLSAGTLEAAAVSATGSVSWVAVSPSRPYRGRETAAFQRGEGAWISAGVLYFTTTADDRVWALDLPASSLEVIYDGVADPTGALHNPDNITVHDRTGHLYVAEDGDDLQLVLFHRDGGTWTGAPFLQLVDHRASEVTGPAFSPDGERLYVNSQRGRDGKTGLTFEVTGPFG